MDETQLIEALRQHFGSEFRATESGGRESIIEWLAAREGLDDSAARERVAAMEERRVLRYQLPESPSGDVLTMHAARYGTSILPESAEGLWQIGPRP